MTVTERKTEGREINEENGIGEVEPCIFKETPTIM